MVQSLCKLYDVPVKEVKIESFIRLAGGRGKQMTAITLAITGNAAVSWFAKGKSRSNAGLKDIIREILDSLDRDSILLSARTDIMHKLKGIKAS